MKINTILKEFEQLNIKVAFGFEFEFYLLDKTNNPIKNIDMYLEQIRCVMLSNNFLGYVEKENSPGQAEISSIATFDINNAIKSCKIILLKIINSLSECNVIVNHKAKPFLNKPGSGLHINISLHDPSTLENLFAIDNNYRADIKNKLMSHSIGGLLSSVESNVYQYLTNESIKSRIKNPDRNTPINFSWGQNNRTTMIRIPESLPHAKRLENRVPSSENSIYDMTYYTMSGL